MRTNNIIKNIFFGIGSTIITTFLSFFVRTLFIWKLGTTYLGVSGLLSNVLSMLSLAELGVGTAIGFSLYKPLATRDEEKINSLMTYYKKTYLKIGLFVFAIGLCLTPFLDFFIKGGSSVSNLTLIYLLYLVNTSYSYLFSYKRTIIHSDQKGYIISKYTTLFKLLLSGLQVGYLMIANNFIVYLLLQFLVGVIENIYINNKINKLHPYLNSKKSKKLTDEDLLPIRENINGMIFHKIGDYCINGTDNIIISKYISIVTVGLYSNYTMLLSTVSGILNTIFYSATASFGNLLTTEGKNKTYEKFQVFNFLGYWLYGFATVAFYTLFNPFIKLWIGSKFLLSTVEVILICANFYLTSMRIPLGIVKSSAGVYKQDKYIPLIQSVINLAVSVVLVKMYGLTGVLLGTLVSSVLIANTTRPYYVYKYVFNKSVLVYFKSFLKYLCCLIGQIFVVSLVAEFINIDNKIIEFLFLTLIVITIPNLLNIIIFNKTNELKEIKKIINKIIKRGE